jgi:hypothetical protein
MYAKTCLDYNPIYASCITGMTGVRYHTQLLLVDIGACELFFCPGWSQTLAVLISAS